MTLCKWFGYWECKEEDQWDCKEREEGVDVFRRRKFEWLALIETKVKGNGEVSWCGGNGVFRD